MWYTMRRIQTVALAMVVVIALAALVGCASGASATPTATQAGPPLPPITVIPTPTDPVGQALQRAATVAAGPGVRAVGVTYDVNAQTVSVTITVEGDVPNTNARIAAAYARIKALCFQEQAKLWASGQPLQRVTVTIMGPAQDAYSGIINQIYGIATLGQSTARTFPWASATPENAWGRYDQIFLRPSFVVIDDVPGNVPTAPPSPTQ